MSWQLTKHKSSPFQWTANSSWDDLIASAKQDHAYQMSSSPGGMDFYTGGTTRIGNGQAQIYLTETFDATGSRAEGTDPWSNAVFNTKTSNTPNGYMSQLYRNADGTIGERFYKESSRFPWQAAAVIAAPFAAAAMGAGGAAGAAGTSGGSAAGAGAAGAGAGAGAAGAGAGAGWVSAEMGAGYLGGMAADAAALSGAAGAAGGAAGWTSGYDLAGGAALPSGSSSGLSGLLSQAADKVSNMGITDWINLAGTAVNYFGAQKSADALKDGSEASIAEQRRQYDQTRADQLPWMLSGYNALSGMNAGLAPGGEFAKNFTEEDFWADPVTKLGFQFGLDEGTKGVNRLAAAKGSLDSGATLKELTRYATDYSGTKANDSFNRFNANRDSKWNKLASLAGVGQTATNTVTAAGQQTANNVSQGLQDIGSARASSYIGGINAINGGISNYMNYTSQNQLLAALEAAARNGNRLY